MQDNKPTVWILQINSPADSPALLGVYTTRDKGLIALNSYLLEHPDFKHVHDHDDGTVVCPGRCDDVVLHPVVMDQEYDGGW